VAPAPEKPKQLIPTGDKVTLTRGAQAGRVAEIVGFSDHDGTYAVRYEDTGQFAVIQAKSLKPPAEKTLTVSELATAVDKANLPADLPETERLMASLETVAPGIGKLVTSLYNQEG
jgi:hypothetical protein